jgi:hypothetical protein
LRWKNHVINFTSVLVLGLKHPAPLSEVGHLPAHCPAAPWPNRIFIFQNVLWAHSFFHCLLHMVHIITLWLLGHMWICSLFLYREVQRNACVLWKKSDPASNPVEEVLRLKIFILQSSCTCIFLINALRISSWIIILSFEQHHHSL